MVGCLGGLGRSLSRWMFHQGARRFVFLSRSGTKKIAAKQLVQDLRENGASIDVMVGDVSVFTDVEAVVSQIIGSIGGIVQAAMGLDVGRPIHTTSAIFSWLKCRTPCLSRCPVKAGTGASVQRFKAHGICTTRFEEGETI